MTAPPPSPESPSHAVFRPPALVADPPSIRLAKAIIAFVSTAIIAYAVATGLFGFQGFGGSPVVPTLGLTFLITIGIRIGLWLAYRPAPRDQTPTLTVVVPAYNEGPGVRQTIESLLASDYPRDRLRVIAVNDGSKDDTGIALDRTRADLLARGDDRLTVIHLPKNMGKRHALHTGFKQADTELVATVDSDSYVLADTLANLVAPFATPHVGGVAGKVLVANRETNLLTRMLHVRYVLGFDFVRAYQDKLASVWCCPGALQAYRRSVIAPHLDRWLDQRFLGARCTNGDDHAMTNLVLSLGCDTRYQGNAVVYTLVPETYKRLSKMFLRWARSATREGLLALAFVPGRMATLSRRAKNPVTAVTHPIGMALDAIAQPVSVGLRFASIFFGVGLALLHPLILAKTLIASTLIALPYAAVYLRSERHTDVLFGVLYGWFALFALFWIQPLAVITVRKNGWMTRG